MLNEIIEKTDCEIVVSSDWRVYKDLDYMTELYSKRGIIKSPIGYTDVLDISADMLESTRSYKDHNEICARVRENEINHWLDKHSHVELWAAVDDLYMSKLKRFVHTPHDREGIKQTGIKDKIIELLTYTS